MKSQAEKLRSKDKMSENLPARISELEKSLAAITNIDGARKLLIQAKFYVVAAFEYYQATKNLTEVKEDRDNSFQMAVNAGELRLRVEARLGELIKEEQEAGRLATEGRPNKGNTDVTFLKDYDLTKMDSSRAQKIAEYQDLITEIVATAVENRDPPTRKLMNKMIKEIEHEEKIEILRKEIPLLIPPDGPFDVIVVDPPWPYGNEYDAEGKRSASPYPEMSIEKIKAIKLSSSENCVLWLWTTNAFMHEAYHILDVWGFEPKTILTWAKDRMGLGQWLRNQTEHCILAVKGSPTVDLKNQTTILNAKNKGHSTKPDEFYDLVDSLCIGSKIDWFSRTPRLGWATFGTMELKNSIDNK
jgi:N6-adenosine-specific RNA methylase IME4